METLEEDRIGTEERREDGNRGREGRGKKGRRKDGRGGEGSRGEGKGGVRKDHMVSIIMWVRDTIYQEMWYFIFFFMISCP